MKFYFSISWAFSRMYIQKNLDRKFQNDYSTRLDKCFLNTNCLLHYSRHYGFTKEGGRHASYSQGTYNLYEKTHKCKN